MVCGWADATNFAPALLVFDERMLQFFVGRAPVTLTPSQHRLLVYLYHNQGRVCTREKCAEAVWGD